MPPLNSDHDSASAGRADLPADLSASVPTETTACGHVLPSSASGDHSADPRHDDPPTDVVAAAHALAGDKTGRDYWRSLDEFVASPEFRAAVDREFPSAAQDLVTSDDRRQFIKVMGASFAMAGLTLAGCRRWPEETIAPFASRPENRTPGEAVGYATCMELGGSSLGLVVSSFDGRPIKIEGNELHPTSAGATDTFAQASVLGLYDPDRSRTLLDGGHDSSLDAFTAFIDDHRSTLSANDGAGLAILTEASASPSVVAMHRRLRAAYPAMKWVQWEPVNDDNERLGTAAAVGSPQRVFHTLHDGTRDGVRARVTVSLGSDFLGDHPDMVRLTREHARTRRLDADVPAQQELGRLYSIDAGGTITAGAADEHIPVRTVDVAAVAASIAEKVLEATGDDASLRQTLSRIAASAGARAAMDARDRQVVDQLVADLVANRGRSVVIAGRTQPPEVHALACLLNDRLGNVGQTVRYLPSSPLGSPGDPDIVDGDATSIAALRSLVESMESDEINTLVVVGANPVYTAPADLDFVAALAKVPTTIHLGLHFDETARRCRWHLPRAHYLECWGDGRAFDGTVSIAQPLIEPMVAGNAGGLSPIELFARLAGDSIVDGQSIVRRTFGEMTGASETDFDRRWRTALHDGVVLGTDYVESSRRASIDSSSVTTALERLAERMDGLAADAIEIVFRACTKVYDGRFANNGWLQELPESMTKIAWDNAAVIGVATAQRLGLRTGDMATLTVAGRSLDAAILVLPGYASNSIWLALGYGRGDEAGRVAADAGFNAYRIRTSEAADIALGATVAKAGGRYTLVASQDRGAGNPVADRGVQARLPQIVREAPLAEYHDKPNFAKYRAHVAHRLSLWEESNLDGARHRWAMSVDLNTCTGCNACVVACQAENNIPIVGKEQMRRGREMHWIRIDRYFRGSDPNRPDAVAFQPIACMHCENAPCEQVCPVAATVHDEEGLNVMVYNRCIGTRYCSNNCPYKVRRFNYFDWHRMDQERGADWIQHPTDYYFRGGPNQWQALQFNPEVTIRTRGVMEKCTFCTQRINEGRIKAKNAWARAGGRLGPTSDYVIPDGTITPACAQACPAQAIVFGDLNDKESRVAKLMAKPVSYQLLEELNTKTRLRFLARVRNPGVGLGRGAGPNEPPTAVTGRPEIDARHDGQGAMA